MSLQAAIRPLKKNVADRKIILRALSGEYGGESVGSFDLPESPSMKEKIKGDAMIDCEENSLLHH